MLPAERWDAWLDRSVREPGHLQHLLEAPAPGLLTLRPVSTAVNDVRNDHAGLVDAVAR